MTQTAAQKKNLDKLADWFGMPQCTTCVHWHEEEGDTCDAFPKGIPLDIASNEFDHTEHYEGDNNILYQKKVGETPTGV